LLGYAALTQPTKELLFFANLQASPTIQDNYSYLLPEQIYLVIKTLTYSFHRDRCAGFHASLTHCVVMAYAIAKGKRSKVKV